MTDSIRVETDGSVARVILDRPDRHNAFDDSVIARLQSAFDELGAREDIRVVQLCAEGKSFSAGADLAWMQRMADYTHKDNMRDAGALAEMLHTLATLPQPTIARVQGAAFGGGVGLVACCDIAVASEAAVFCLSEVKIGLIPATISPYVIHAMGRRNAQRYFLTAERFDAREALRIGLVHQSTPAASLDAAVAEVTDAICRNGPQAVRASKNLIAAVDGRPVDTALREETSRRIADIRVSPEGQEGLAAFLGKRAPEWTN